MNLKQLCFYNKWVQSYTTLIRVFPIYPVLKSTKTERRQLLKYPYLRLWKAVYYTDKFKNWNKKLRYLYKIVLTSSLHAHGYAHPLTTYTWGYSEASWAKDRYHIKKCQYEPWGTVNTIFSLHYSFHIPRILVHCSCIMSLYDYIGPVRRTDR